MLYFKCVECQCLFPKKALTRYAKKHSIDVYKMDCPICGCRFTDGQLGQEFHGREVEMENPITASPDDR